MVVTQQNGILTRCQKMRRKKTFPSRQIWAWGSFFPDVKNNWRTKYNDDDHDNHDEIYEENGWKLHMNNMTLKSKYTNSGDWRQKLSRRKVSNKYVSDIPNSKIHKVKNQTINKRVPLCCFRVAGIMIDKESSGCKCTTLEVNNYNSRRLSAHVV